MPDTFITVRVGKLPGTIVDVALNGAHKASDALTAAGLSADGYEIRVNGSAAAPDTDLSDGDTVLLVKKIKGNVAA